MARARNAHRHTASTATPRPARRSSARILLAWLPALAWFGFISWFSAQGGTASDAQSNTMGDLLSYPWEHIFSIRKVAHLALFAVQGALCWFAWGRYGLTTPRRIAAAAALCMLLGTLDEAHQHFVPARTALLLDVWVDTLGATLGACLCALAARWWVPKA